MINSRAKGARYMLAVCRLLSHWACGTALDAKASDLAFRTRSTSITPFDGHWLGAGDILCRPGVFFPFCVECKNDEHGKLDSILEAPKWPVWAWWEQTQEQAEKTGLTPLLIFSRALRENYVLMNRLSAVRLKIEPRRGPVLDITRPNGERLTLCLLDDLLALPRSRLKTITLTRKPS